MPRHAVVRSRIIDEGRRARSRRGWQRTGGPWRDRHGNDDVGRRGHRRQRCNRTNVPDSVNRIGERQVFLARPRRGVVRRTRAMIGAFGTDRKDVQIRWQRAGPGIFEGHACSHCLVEGRRRRRKDDCQVMVIAHRGRTDVLDTYIHHRTAADRGEVPRHRARRATDRTARRRTGLGRDRWRFVEQQHQDRQAQQANCGGPGKSANDSHEQTSKAHSFRRSCVTEPRLCTPASRRVCTKPLRSLRLRIERQWIGQSFMPRYKCASSRLGSSPSEDGTWGGGAIISRASA